MQSSNYACESKLARAGLSASFASLTEADFGPVDPDFCAFLDVLEADEAAEEEDDDLEEDNEEEEETGEGAEDDKEEEEDEAAADEAEEAATEEDDGEVVDLALEVEEEEEEEGKDRDEGTATLWTCGALLTGRAICTKSNTQLWTQREARHNYQHIFQVVSVDILILNNEHVV